MSLPRPSQSMDDVRAFFDDFARRNVDQHGPLERQLAYRVGLLAAHASFRPDDVVLDLGCGDGNHLRALAGRIGRGIGIDVAPGMIESARRATDAEHLDFRTDDARHLETVAPDAVDVVISVGALEHMIEPGAMLRSVARVLRPGGRFVCLTLHGDYLWYRTVAPALRYATRHLATDRRLTAPEAQALLQDAGFGSSTVDYWSFVPRGDMPPILAALFDGLDALGRWLHLPILRGGLLLSAHLP